MNQTSAPTSLGTTYKPTPAKDVHPVARVAIVIAAIIGIAIFKVAAFDAITSGYNAIHDTLTDRDGARLRGTPAAQAMIASLASARVSSDLVPAGFSDPESDQLADLPKKLTDHHAIAGSTIALDGSDDMAYVRYYGFAIKQDAQDFYDSVVPVPLDKASLSTESTPSGFKQSVRCRQFTGEDTTTHAKSAGTTCYTLMGNVCIAGTAVSTGKDNRRDSAIALLRLGIAQYQAVMAATN